MERIFDYALLWYVMLGIFINHRGYAMRLLRIWGLGIIGIAKINNAMAGK